MTRIVADGFSCYPVFERDPWLDPLRTKAAFRALVDRCDVRHAKSVAAFDALDGRAVLGIM
jgi:hypothetical protein